MAEGKDPLIFADKIKKEFIFWHKALTIRENYEQMFSKYRTGQLKEDELIKLNDFNMLWVSIAELYGILEFRYLKILLEILPEEHKRLQEIINRYRVKGEKMNFNDASFAVQTLQKICSLNGFDDVSIQSNYKRDFLKPTKEWNEE